MTNIPRSFLRSRHVCVLSARHCLGPGDHSGERDSLGLHGSSVPGAMPPLAATVATDGSPPRVTVSACSPVLREVCPGHVIHGSAFHRLHGHRCCRQQGMWLGKSGHRDTIHTQGWRVHAVSFPARAGSGHLWVVVPSDCPGVQRGGPPGGTHPCAQWLGREPSPGSAGTTLPRLSASFQGLRLLEGRGWV